MKTNIDFEEYINNVKAALVSYVDCIDGGSFNCKKDFYRAHAKFAESIFPSSFNEKSIKMFSKKGYGLEIYLNNKVIILDCNKIGSIFGFLLAFSASGLFFDEQGFKELMFDLHDCKELSYGSLGQEEIYNLIMGFGKKYAKERFNVERKNNGGVV